MSFKRLSYAARFGSPAAVHRWLGLKVGGIKLRQNCTSKTAISRSGKASPRDDPNSFVRSDGLALVEADWLDETFGYRGPFWSRHYRFFRSGTALTVIREVFSPQLETWLGSTLRQELQRSS
jgi:hypothetical protein